MPDEDAWYGQEPSMSVDWLLRRRFKSQLGFFSDVSWQNNALNKKYNWYINYGYSSIDYMNTYAIYT